MYIIASSTISHQKTFNKKGFSENLIPLNNSIELQKPAYKEFIEAGMLRRMTEIIRMSVCCSMDCIRQSSENIDAIIVGTGLGCLHDTEKFLTNVITTSPDGLISPTSFIQSTHNTIAGQLSLILKNHNYNMTHTQNTLSFEHALQDCLLCLKEGKENILLGAADEHIALLNNIAEKLNYKNIILTSGASFFILSNKKTENAKVKVAATSVSGHISDLTNTVQYFIRKNEINVSDIDVVLFSSANPSTEQMLRVFFNNKLMCDYQKYCGTYFSNSGFAFHLALDIVERKKIKFDFMDSEQTNINTILICNNLNSTNLGLTLVKSIET